MKIFDGQKGKRLHEAEYLTFTHKNCPQCDEVKAVSEFYRKTTRTARGWAWDTHCIVCRNSYSATYAAGNKERRNARLSAWRKKNPKAASANDRRKALRQKYGIDTATYDRMREDQDGKCAICDKTTARLFVDHCHQRGHRNVRALLCQTCNTFLGWYEKKASAILKFQAYLNKHT